MGRQCPGWLGRVAGVWPLRRPDWPALQGPSKQVPSLKVGSDLIKFEETVTKLESGTFFFRTPKVQPPGGRPGCGTPVACRA